MTAYYNEHDKHAAAWLRELIRCGHIADGIVDERSIADVLPSDLDGFVQCHFFAGIGVWSYALRLAGWPDDRPVWTGSCPCQPFSVAGKGGGFDDERHLWPHFHYLIEQRRPDVIFGEQVASKDGLAWFDLVHADMEGTGYAVGAADLCAAGFGAPHIRQRLYWVADSERGAAERWRYDLGAASGSVEIEARQRERVRPDFGTGVLIGVLDDSDLARLEGRSGVSERADKCTAGTDGVVSALADPAAIGSSAGAREPSARNGAQQSKRPSDARSMADADSSGREEQRISGLPKDRDAQPWRDAYGRGANGFWRDADYIPCRDGKARPIESDTSPLVDGASARVVRGGDRSMALDAKRSSEARVMRLRGYGNAIVAPVAQAFIEAYLEGRE